MATSPHSVTLGLVQSRSTPDPAENFRQAIAGVREARSKGAQIVCLPELFRSQYFCQTEDHATSSSPRRSPAPARKRWRASRPNWAW